MKQGNKTIEIGFEGETHRLICVRTRGEFCVYLDKRPITSRGTFWMNIDRHG